MNDLTRFKGTWRRYARGSCRTSEATETHSHRLRGKTAAARPHIGDQVVRIGSAGGKQILLQSRPRMRGMSNNRPSLGEQLVYSEVTFAGAGGNAALDHSGRLSNGRAGAVSLRSTVRVPVGVFRSARWRATVFFTAPTRSRHKCQRSATWTASGGPVPVLSAYAPARSRHTTLPPDALAATSRPCPWRGGRAVASTEREVIDTQDRDLVDGPVGDRTYFPQHAGATHRALRAGPRAGHRPVQT